MSKTKPAFRKRIKALLLDYLVILAWMLLIVAINIVLFVVIFDGFPDYLGLFGVYGTQLLFFLILTLPVGLYLFFTESGKHKATPGKRKFGLKVVGMRESATSKKQIAVRTFIKLLPWELAHAFIWQMQYVFYTEGYDAMPPVWVFVGLNFATLLVVLYIVMVAVRKDGRAPHDLVAKTMVVIDA